jgi:hypothetical protein
MRKAQNNGSEKAPAWANGLKQLYDDVVEEPLPDAFKDLLAQLDSSDAAPSDGASTDKGGS